MSSCAMSHSFGPRDSGAEQKYLPSSSPTSPSLVTLLTQQHFTSLNTGKGNYSWLLLWPWYQQGWFPYGNGPIQVQFNWSQKKRYGLVVDDIFICHDGFKCNMKEPCAVSIFNSALIPASIWSKLRSRTDFSGCRFCLVCDSSPSPTGIHQAARDCR